MNGYGGERYILEYIVAIDLEAVNLAFMASALEEFLIAELRSELNLLNGTGT